MKPASRSIRRQGETKVLLIDPQADTPIIHDSVKNLIQYFKRGDVLVINQSGTLPSSFRGKVKSRGFELEVRLASFRGGNSTDLARWAAVLFGEGDWRLPTEKRGAVPLLQRGDIIEFSGSLSATILAVHPEFPRLVELKFSSPDLVKDLYRLGRPIQYSYLRDRLEVWDQQTLFSGLPLSVEPPCAAFPFQWEQLIKIQALGVEILPVLHSAGLSSTGDPGLDKQFPLPEYFEIPERTCVNLARALSEGRRVIALGTSVARALESDSSGNYTELRLDSQSKPKRVSVLITGMHELSTSHGDLMTAFCKRDLLEAALNEADTHGYLSHEYGDLMWIERESKEREQV